MPKYQITSPDTGKTYTVTAPDGTSPAQLKARIRRFEKHAGYTADRLLQERFMQNITLGGWDEIAGFTEAATKEAIEAFGGKESDFWQAYEQAKAQSLAKGELAGKVSPLMAGTSDVASILYGGGGATQGIVNTARAGLRELMKQGAKVGAGMGAVGGFLSGEGLEGRLAGTVGGAPTGALFGAALPAAFLGTARGVQWLNRFFRGDKNAGLRYLDKVMRDEGITADEVVQRMEAAQDVGVELRPADVAPGLRGALGGAVRDPSALRNQVLSEVTERQKGLTDRVIDSVSRYLGPIRNIRKTEQDLIEIAQAKAEPLYKAAYAKAGVWNKKLARILETSAGKKALANAYHIADNEMRDPTKLGFDIAEISNEIILTRQPSMQTLDYIKRGFDDVINTYRIKDGPKAGQLNLDEGGRAIRNLQKEFVGELDRLNPAYAQARAAWGGETARKNAMLDGEEALNYEADDLEYILDKMNPIDQDFFKLGYRKALSNLLESKGDLADTTKALLGTRRKRKALQTVFGNSADFDSLERSVANEALSAATYQKLTGNSTTAEKLFEALDYSDALAGTSGGGASLLRGDAGGLLQAAMSKLQRLASETTRKAADETVMRTLMAPTPQAAEQELANIGLLQAAEAAQRQQQATRAALPIVPSSTASGLVAGQALSEVPTERRPLPSAEPSSVFGPKTDAQAINAWLDSRVSYVDGIPHIDGEAISVILADGTGVTPSGKVARVQAPY